MTKSTGYREQRRRTRQLALALVKTTRDRLPLLSHGGEIDSWAYVDPDDWERLKDYSWSMSSGYAVRYENQKLVFMHHDVNGHPPEGHECDHKNRDRIDNRRHNLGNKTKKENRQNRSGRGISRFRGVSSGYQNSWRVTASINGQYVDDGCYSDELLAACRAQYLHSQQEGYEPDLLLEDALRERYSYDAWPSGEPYDWSNACRGNNPYDLIDHMVDIGCGTIKKGRIGIDRHPASGVDIVLDLERLAVAQIDRRSSVVRYKEIGRLPFATSSIVSVVSHHAMEHIGEGFIPLVDEIYRVLVPNGVFRVTTPLFPSTAAVEDPDHCRYFMAHEGGGGTWDAFCGAPWTPHWTESFSVPYTKARFAKVDQILTPRITDVHDWWGPHDQRELRVALKAMK